MTEDKALKIFISSIIAFALCSISFNVGGCIASSNTRKNESQKIYQKAFQLGYGDYITDESGRPVWEWKKEGEKKEKEEKEKKEIEKTNIMKFI